MEDQDEYIISYANILSGFFKNQSDFLDYPGLKKFYNELCFFPSITHKFISDKHIE